MIVEEWRITAYCKEKKTSPIAPKWGLQLVPNIKFSVALNTEKTPQYTEMFTSNVTEQMPQPGRLGISCTDYLMSTTSPFNKWHQFYHWTILKCDFCYSFFLQKNGKENLRDTSFTHYWQQQCDQICWHLDAD